MADYGDVEQQKSAEKTNNLNLNSILEAFNAPINEEQAWAVCYQSAKCAVEYVNEEKCMCFCGLESVVIFPDGTIHQTSNTLQPNSEKTVTESQIIRSLGSVIYSALDYGLDNSEEHHLSSSLEDLIEIMTAGNDSDSQTADEGFENDLEGSPVTLSEVMQMCLQHLNRPEDAPDHYKAVCRALFTEAIELLTFLEKISASKECLQSNDLESDDLKALDRVDWARVWVQVLKQLRQGVKLKKVEQVDLRPVEFEFTPYEILIEDIKLRRYTLNKIMIDGEIPPVVKHDAHSVILDFIRSRPPLQPVSERKLRSPPPKSPILHEQLLEAIRNEPKLRKTPAKIVETSRTKICDEDMTPLPTRKVIKADFSRFCFDDESDDEDDFSISTEIETYAGYSSPDMLSPVSPLSPDKSPPRLYPSNEKIGKSWKKAVALDLIMNDSGNNKIPERRHSITVCESPVKSKKRWLHPVECLSLTVEEVMHIRTVLAKAELESLLVNPSLYTLVARGKVCFTCKLTKFSLFSWGAKCKFCGRKVCQKCIKKMNVPTEHFQTIPVYVLSPSPLSPKSHAELYHSSESTGSAPPSPITDRKSNSNHREDNNNRNKLKPPPQTNKKKLEGQTMNICKDCKSLVLNVIRASRTTIALSRLATDKKQSYLPAPPPRAARKLHLDLTPVYKC